MSTISLPVSVALHGMVMAGVAWWGWQAPPRRVDLPKPMLVSLVAVPMPDAKIPAPQAKPTPHPPEEAARKRADRAQSGQTKTRRQAPAAAPAPSMTAPITSENGPTTTPPASAAVGRDDSIPTDTAASPQTGAGDAAAARIKADYFSRLREWLDRYKHYPQRARSQSMQGVVMLRFVMDRSGHILSHDLEKSSGFSPLDRAALSMLDQASPLPPPPDEITGNTLELVLPVGFTLR